MTIKVKITHDQPGYLADIVVHPLDRNNVHFPPANSVQVKPGQTIEMYVHHGQKLLIEEVPPAP